MPINKKKAMFQQIGARNYANEERAKDDFYSTEPKALELLLDKETFNHNIWECACGNGALSNILTSRGFDVRNTDIVDRGGDILPPPMLRIEAGTSRSIVLTH